MAILLLACLLASGATSVACHGLSSGLRSGATARASTLSQVDAPVPPSEKNASSIRMVRDPHWNGKTLQDEKTFAKDYVKDTDKRATGKVRPSVQDAKTYHNDYTTDAKLPSGEPVAQTVEQKAAIADMAAKKVKHATDAANTAVKHQANVEAAHKEQINTIAKEKNDAFKAGVKVDAKASEVTGAKSELDKAGHALNVTRKELEAQEEKYADVNQDLADAKAEVEAATRKAAVQHSEAKVEILEGQKHEGSVAKAQQESRKAKSDLHDAERELNEIRKDLKEAKKVKKDLDRMDRHKSAAAHTAGASAVSLIVAVALLYAL